MKTQVAITVAGPAGPALGHLLTRMGFDTVIVERQFGDYVLGRVPTNMLEQGIVDLLEAAGPGTRMWAEGIPQGLFRPGAGAGLETGGFPW